MNNPNVNTFVVDIRKVDANIEKMMENLTSGENESKIDYLSDELTKCCHVLHAEEIQTFLHILTTWKTQIKNRMDKITEGKKANTIPDDHYQFKIGVQMTSSTIDGIGCMFPTILTDILASKVDGVNYLTLFLPYDYSRPEEAGSLLSEALLIFDRIMEEQKATHIFVTGIPDTLWVFNSIQEDLYSDDEICTSSSLTMDEYLNIDGRVLYTNIDHHKSFADNEIVTLPQGEVRVTGIQELIECGLDVDKKVLGVAESFETLEDRFRALDEEDWCYGVPISSSYITFAVFIKAVDQLLTNGKGDNWIDPYRQIGIKLQLQHICREISEIERDYTGYGYEEWKEHSILENMNLLRFHNLYSIHVIIDHAYTHIMDDKMNCIPKEYLCKFDTSEDVEQCIAREYAHKVVAVREIPRGETILDIEDKHPWLICEMPMIGSPIWIGYDIMNAVIHTYIKERLLTDSSCTQVDSTDIEFNGIVYFERHSNRILIFFYRNESIDAEEIMTSIVKQYNYRSSLNWSTIELYDPEMKKSLMSIYDKKNEII